MTEAVEENPGYLPYSSKVEASGSACVILAMS
jgi:hypothetical protein